MILPFGVYKLVEFPTVGLCHAFTACQNVDFTCKKGTVTLNGPLTLYSTYFYCAAYVLVINFYTMHEILVIKWGDWRTEGEGTRRWEIMRIAIASALLHLPKDFKKEFNGTIGFSWLGTRQIIQWGTRPQENSIREQIENMCLWGPSLQHKPNPSMILAPLANCDQMQESLNTSSNNNSEKIGKNCDQPKFLMYVQVIHIMSSF